MKRDVRVSKAHATVPVGASIAIDRKHADSTGVSAPRQLYVRLYKSTVQDNIGKAAKQL